MTIYRFDSWRLGSPRFADQSSVGAFRAGERRGRRGWIEQQLDESTLILAGTSPRRRASEV